MGRAYFVLGAVLGAGQQRETEADGHSRCLGAAQPVWTADYKHGKSVKYITRW